MKWQTIETAPKDGSQFLALQDGEVYAARYIIDGTPRLAFRTHQRFLESKHAVVKVDFHGKETEAHVPIDQPWKERFDHHWTYWTKGFEFEPTHWTELKLP